LKGDLPLATTSESGELAKLKRERFNLRLVIIAIVCFLFGTACLAALDIIGPYLIFKVNKQLMVLAHHVFAIVSAVGIVGFIYEMFAHRRLAQEILDQMRTLLNEDPTSAQSLSNEARQERVANTLKAHLGARMGAAIYEGLVKRYLVYHTAYREDATYKITLKELQEDITITSGTEHETAVMLSKENYFKLFAHYSFIREITDSQRLIACTLSETEGYTALYSLFRQPECLIREVVQLDEHDKQKIDKLFKDFDKPDSTVAVINQLFSFQAFLDGQEVTVKHQLIDAGLQSGCTFSWNMILPSEIAHRKSVKYDIKVRSICAKSFHRFPVLLGEPALNPEIELTYPSGLKVATVPFINGDEPFDPRKIMNDPEECKITVAISGINGGEAWVFPNSGVLFVWGDK